MGPGFNAAGGVGCISVTANVAPALFVTFAEFYGIKLPSRQKKVLTGTAVDGTRMYEVKEVLFIPGRTHMKELPAIGGELHKMQVGAWLHAGGGLPAVRTPLACGACQSRSATCKWAAICECLLHAVTDCAVP
mgnify:CR=1 FL=1